MACQWGKNRKNFSLGRERRWHPRLGIAFVAILLLVWNRKPYDSLYRSFFTHNKEQSPIWLKAQFNGESLHFGDLLDITLAHGALIASVQSTNYFLKIDN